MISNQAYRSVSLVCMVVLLLAGVSNLTFAGDDITLQNLAQDEFDKTVRDLGVAMSYVPTEPAEQLGITGVNVGAEVSVADLKSDNNYMDSAFGGNSPGDLAMPKIRASKGLPMGVDVEGFISGHPSGNARLIGAAAKYSWMEGSAAMPAIGVRGHATQLFNVDDLDLRTYGADVSISKGFTILTPYAGYSVFKIKGSQSAGIPVNDHTTTENKFFGGARLSMGLINFVGEVDVGEVNVYSVRANIGF
ncbi:MAG: hypothetical protein ABEJ65_10590 [bacterium]